MIMIIGALVPGWVTVWSCIFSYVVYNLVGAFLGLANMLRGDSLFARVDSQCAEKIVKMCRTCVGCVGMTTKMEDDKNGR